MGNRQKWQIIENFKYKIFIRQKLQIIENFKYIYKLQLGKN